MTACVGSYIYKFLCKLVNIYINFWWMAAYRNTWMFLIQKLETLECMQMGYYSISSQAYVKHAGNRQT